MRHGSAGLRPLTSAMVACQYIVDAFPDSGRSLKCASLLDSAHEHFLLNYMEKHLAPLFGLWRDSAESLVAGETTQREHDAASDRLVEVIRVVAREVRGVPFAVTGAPCLADVVMHVFLSRVPPELLVHFTVLTRALDAIRVIIEKP